MAARLVVTSGFGSGVVLSKLTILDGACQKIERVDNNNAFSATIAWPAPVAQRSTLRLTSADGRQSEYRVTSIQESDDRTEARIDAAGPWLSIARAGLIRSLASGSTGYAFGGQYSISEALLEFFLPHLAEDGLAWISDTLGPIETDALCRLSFVAWNRTQLLQSIIQQTGFEPYLYQSAPGALYQIACRERRGSDAVPFTVADRTNLLRRATDQSDVEILTGVTPLGMIPAGDDSPSDIGENAWTVSVIGSGWVQLLDPAGLVQPIAFDAQYTGKFVEVATTVTPTYREILATRKPDQAILLADTTGLSTANLLVRICENAAGEPLARLVNPFGVTTYGKVFDTEEVSDARGERNWVPNGGFLGGATGWTPGFAGLCDPWSVTENADTFGFKDGSSPISTSVCVVKGFPPNTIVHKNDLLRTQGAQLCTAPAGAGHTITSDGKATITSVTPLAFSVTNGQVLSMDWLDDRGALAQATVTVDGAQSASATTLNLKAFAVVTRKLTLGDLLQFEYGGTYTGRTAGNNGVDNPTASPIVQSRVWGMETDAFTNGFNVPTTPTLVIGDPVTVTDLAGRVYSATLTADHVYGSGTLSLDVTVPAYTTFKYYGSNSLLIAAVKTDYASVTLTNASVEFSEGGTATATWASGLAHAYNTAHVRWMTSGSVLVAYLAVVSGAGSGATSAVLSYPTRARVYPGAVFGNGSIGAGTLRCITRTQLDATGAGSIPIYYAYAAIPDNVSLVLYRNIWGWATPPQVTSVLNIVNSAISTAAPVLLRGTVPRTVWCVVEASVYTPLTYGLFAAKSAPDTNKCPVRLDVYDGVTTHTVTASLDIPPTWATTDVRPMPVHFTLKVSFDLTASRMVTVKLSSPDNSVANDQMHLVMHSAQIVVSPDPDVPFTHSSHATQLVQRGNRRLLDADIATPSVRGTVIDLSQIPNAQLVPQQIAIGQDIYLRDYDTTQRAMQVTSDPRDTTLLQVDFNRDTPRFEFLVVG